MTATGNFRLERKRTSGHRFTYVCGLPFEKEMNDRANRHLLHFSFQVPDLIRLFGNFT